MPGLQARRGRPVRVLARGGFKPTKEQVDEEKELDVSKPTAYCASGAGCSFIGPDGPDVQC